MHPDTKARFVGLFGLGVITVWLTLSIGSNFFYSLTSRHWPKAQALITSSAVIARSSNAGTLWAPDVEYEYRVGGKTFRSANIRYPMPAFNEEEAAADMLAAYSEGHEHSVAYDPGDPSRSVLETGVPPGMWKQALIPLFFWSLWGYIFYEVNNPGRRFLLRSNLDLASGGD
jgi:uncharacterized protein DUF3592